MGQHEEQSLLGGAGQAEAGPPFTGEYMTVEEAVETLDSWVNQWNYPSLPKKKGLPTKERQ